MGSHTKLEVSRLSHRGVAAQVYAVAACWLLRAVRLRNGRCFPPIGRLEMTLHGDFVLFDERHRNIGKVDHLRRYRAQKQTSQPTKTACPHHDLIGHGFARDAVNRLGDRAIFGPRLASPLKPSASCHRLLKYLLRFLCGDGLSRGPHHIREAERLRILDVYQNQQGAWVVLRKPERVVEGARRRR